MTSETTNNASGTGPDATRPGVPPPLRRFKVSPRGMCTGLVIAGLAVGAAGDASADRYLHGTRRQSVLLLQPAPIAQMTDRGAVAVKGHVAEVFGNKFIIEDDSGHTLVDTGRHGEVGKLVTKGDAITVQGVFENGFIHANVLTRADGTSEAFGPPKHPHPDHGFDSDRGPGHDPPPPYAGP